MLDFKYIIIKIYLTYLDQDLFLITVFEILKNKYSVYTVNINE